MCDCAGSAAEASADPPAPSDEPASDDDDDGEYEHSTARLRVWLWFRLVWFVELTYAAGYQTWHVTQEVVQAVTHAAVAPVSLFGKSLSVCTLLRRAFRYLRGGGGGGGGVCGLCDGSGGPTVGCCRWFTLRRVTRRPAATIAAISQRYRPETTPLWSEWPPLF